MTDQDDEESTLPDYLAEMGGWFEIPGLGWLRESTPRGDHADGVDFWWWHDCPPMRDKASYSSLRTIDCSTGERHAITGGSLAGGDLTIHGGSGSIPCDKCGLHGWVRGGKWVTA